MSAESELLATNQAFYAAFREHDLGAMQDLWAEECAVACIHPGWPTLHGREEVLASWARIFEAGDGFDVQCVGAVPHFMGDAAFVTCMEVLDGGQLAATNVFVREAGMWRLVHHQAGPTQGAASAPRPEDTWN